MPEILIAVSNKIPVVVGDTKCIVADNSDYIVRFSFDGQWQDGEKTVYFVRDDGFAYPPVRTESDAVPVPRQESGGINKRLYIGVTQGESRTTRPAGINVLSSITDMIDDEAVQPEPSMWEDVIARLDELEKNGGGGGGIAAETDPTVPEWAKKPEKPEYTASEVGALPDSTKIPSKTSDLTNDSGFVADSQVYARGETYSQTEVDSLIDALSKRLEAVADSDDVTLDQLSEIVTYIKANKSLIDSVTTSKVSISDIVDNLTTGDSKKPLSAAQGKALKALYDAIPAWAKESSKPSYSKSDVGLGSVDNVRQYSASNPPPYPVKSVNGKTGAVTLGAADVGAATAEQFEQLSKEVDGQRIPYIAGDSTTAGAWTGTYEGITEYRDGLTVLYKINIAGVSGGTTLNINGLGAAPVHRNASTAVTTIYPVGSVLLLTYSGGAWLTADYDANTKNTAGTSNKADTKMYLVGATSQTSSGTTTYTNKNVYIGTDNCLYSNGEKVATEAKLSEEIADYQGQLDGKQPIGNYLTEIPDEYVTETELEAEINDLKVQGVQQTPAYPQGETVEDQLAWLAENGDTGKVYLLADGNLYQYKMTENEESTGGYDNRLEKATETYNGTTIYGGGKGYATDVRLSSSGSISTSQAEGMLATGFISAKNGGSLDGARIRTVGFVLTGAPMNCYVIAYNASGEKTGHCQWTGDNANTYIADFTLDSATYGTGIKYIRISASAKGGTLPSIVTVNEEIKESGTTVVKDYAWANTGFAFVPADYEPRIIELERDVAELEKGSKVRNLLGISEVFAPSPQLPADGSEGSDFNGKRESITAEQIYTYIDALLNKYPRYITKELMGKDASGTYDWNRYVCCRRAYDAWQKPNYPPMYAWVNGSTAIYSASVSPRIGDTLYTTTYIGTAKGTVTAVSNANQSRTVGGVVYTRDRTKDVAPMLVYTNTTYSPYFSSNYSSGRKEIYDSSKSKISTISGMSGGTLTGANGVSYTRYPLGDRNSDFEEIPAIVIGANEHGTGGDPATPAMISARMIKDLCECRNADNPLLNLLKNEYMMVFCPVINPWGFDKSNQKYTNSNEVNIDRNFDTPGWKANDPAGWDPGDYGGSENETQYFMNTLVASKTKIAMANHSYGEGLDSTTGEAVSGGICSYMMGRNDSKYTESLLQIAEVMAANYNLVFTDNGEAKPEDWGKTRSYISWIGAEGGALEMNSRDGFVTDPNNEAKGAQFTARVMEAAYTELLQYLYMIIDKQES